jgi:hypothetical protein
MSRDFRIVIGFIALSLLLMSVVGTPVEQLKDNAISFFVLYSILGSAFLAILLPSEKAWKMLRVVGLCVAIVIGVLMLKDVLQDLHTGKTKVVRKNSRSYDVYKNSWPEMFYINVAFKSGEGAALIFGSILVWRHLKNKRTNLKNE